MSDETEFQELCAKLDDVLVGHKCGLAVSALISLVAKQIEGNSVDHQDARNHYVAELDQFIAQYQRRKIPDGSLS